MEQEVVLAARLKELMAEREMGFLALSEKSGVPDRRLRRLAQGVNQDPPISVMRGICKGLDVTLDEFFKLK